MLDIPKKTTNNVHNLLKSMKISTIDTVYKRIRVENLLMLTSILSSRAPLELVQLLALFIFSSLLKTQVQLPCKCPVHNLLLALLPRHLLLADEDCA